MPDALAAPSITFADLLAPGVTAVRKFWRPFVFLQAIAAAIVLLYYDNSHVKAVCDALSRLKDCGGVPFTALAAGTAGGILPELAKAIVSGDRAITRKRARNVGFAFAVFAISGVNTDLVYRGLAVWIGADTRIFTVFRKIMVDQLIYTPFVSTPFGVFAYLLRAEGFSLTRTLPHISARWYIRRVMPLLIPSWVYWTPMVVLVYSLPGSLQFCLFCFASAAWSLVMVFIASGEARAEATTQMLVDGVSTPAA